MHKLNMTPAEVMTLLAEVLSNLDRQIDDYGSREDIPFPA